MLKTILNSIIIQYKILLRDNKKYILLLMLIIGYGLNILQYISISNCDSIANIYSLSAFTSQTFIVLGLILGFFQGYQENVNNCKEVFLSIRKGNLIKNLVKILFGFVVTLFMLLFNLLYNLLLIYLKSNSELSIYSYINKYTIIYWCLPFFISYLIGVLIGEKINNKVSYVLIVVLSLVLGPVLFDVIDSVIEVSGFKEIICSLSIAQIDAHSSYDYMLGFDLQRSLILTRIFALLFMVFLILLISIKYENKKIKKALSLIIPVFFIILFVFNFKIISKHMDRYFYRNIAKQVMKIARSDEYKYISEDVKIKKYDISIFNKVNGMEFDVSMDLDVLEEKNSINLLLYRGFNVKNVKINETSCNYQRNDDELVIKPVDKIRKGNMKIYIKYTGEPMYFMYKDFDKWYLPADFAWIPKTVNKIGSESFNGLYFPYEYSEAEYSLTYNGVGQVFCNLPSAGNNKWRGNAEVGVTLVNALIKESFANNIGIYYPYSLLDFDNNIEKIVERMLNINIDKIYISFKENKKVFVIYSEYIKPAIVNLGDHSIIYLRGGYLQPQDLNECMADLIFSGIVNYKAKGKIIIYENYQLLRGIYINYIYNHENSNTYKLSKKDLVRFNEEIKDVITNNNYKQEYVRLIKFINDAPREKARTIVDKILSNGNNYSSQENLIKDISKILKEIEEGN
ncbi:hypothetical protein [Caloramator sp. ALD01]|uniref:hypothetical protein n=1 Tax=Caloramator sp. ALD01 TaxID=1031288 RepID=UPI00041D2A54|nr:hypothetical protein [Caloramator sp. ALD01]